MEVINSNGNKSLIFLLATGFMIFILVGCIGKKGLVGRWDGETTYLDFKTNNLVEEGIREASSDNYKTQTYKYTINRNTLIFLSTSQPYSEAKRVMYRINGDNLTIFQRRNEKNYKRRH